MRKLKNIIRHTYNYFYKIVNKINGCYYYGVHSTDKINDNYMGSGTRLLLALKKHGINNFEKTILKYFDTIEECYDYEAQIVTSEMINDPSCYNIVEGGGGINTCNKVVVTDGSTNFIVNINNEKFLNGEYVSLHKGLVNVRDENGNCFAIDKNDPKYLDGTYQYVAKNISHIIENGKIIIITKDSSLYSDDKRLIHVLNEKGEFIWCEKEDPKYLDGTYKGLTKYMSPVKNAEGHTTLMSKTDPRFISGEYVGILKGKVVVVDENGNKFSVYTDDPKYLDGTYKHINKGKIASDETRKKLSKAHTGKTLGADNGMYGKHFYTRLEDGKLILRPLSDEEYKTLVNTYNWIKGRIFNINKFLKLQNQ